MLCNGLIEHYGKDGTYEMKMLDLQNGTELYTVKSNIEIQPCFYFIFLFLDYICM